MDIKGLIVAVTLLGTEELVSGWRCSQKEDRPRGYFSLRRRSTLEAVVPSGGSDEERHVS